MILFKGKKKGFIHTMNITPTHIKKIFFPKTFNDKYKYLGAIPYDEESDLFTAIEPLIIFMDYKAKPKYCPRFFLRFLHLFGNDNSIVRVRNWKLHKLHTKLTKGIMFVDYKTKWSHYDLRISVRGDSQINDLSDQIEQSFYNKGYKEFLLNEILKRDTNFKNTHWNINKLAKHLEIIEKI